MSRLPTGLKPTTTPRSRGAVGGPLAGGAGSPAGPLSPIVAPAEITICLAPKAARSNDWLTTSPMAWTIAATPESSRSTDCSSVSANVDGGSRRPFPLIVRGGDELWRARQRRHRQVVSG
jgi:hypothetical protein